MKFSKLQALVLILMLTTVAVAVVAVAKAQGTATVDMLTSVGGSTTPTDTTTYPDGTAVTLTATPGQGFSFNYWTIVSAAGATQDYNNPTTLTVSDDNTYAVQAVFAPTQLPPGQSFNVSSPTNAIVVVLAAVGGTTSPAPGTYALQNAGSLQLTATPANGFKFDHWVIGGVTGTNPHGAYSFTDTPTNNPYTVDHGYGNTYSYQPVFTPTTVPEFSATSTAILAIILVAVAAGAGAFTLSNKSKHPSKVSGIKL
jgi:hypothetical protein